MTREEKLLTLLQPKGYISKLKLYCRDNTFKIEKFREKEKHNKRIKITEWTEEG